MNEILHANIFFVIASVATVVFLILVSYALYQVIKILASIRSIVARVEAGSDMIAEDIQSARDYVTSGSLVSNLIGLAMRKGRSAKPRTRKQNKEDFINDTEE